MSFRSLYQLGLLAALAAGHIIVSVLYHRFQWSFESIGFWLPWRCPLKFFTGISCPTCGLGRALLAALAGEFSLSFAYHPFGPALYGLSLVALPLGLLRNLSEVFKHKWVSRKS